MKTIAVAILGLGLVTATPVFADPAHHPDAPKAGAQMPGGDMIGARMDMMRAQLERIASAKTDAERQAAMSEHMQAMQQGMPMGADGMPMVGCPMMQGGMMGGASGEMGQRMHQMEQRMDMMQMMMKNMMGGRGPMGQPAQ